MQSITLRAEAPSSTRTSRVNILGVGISTVDMEEALTQTESVINADGKAYICVTGVHGIMEAQRDQALRETLNTSFLCVPDGMPTVWVGRIYGFRKMRRVYGPDFMLDFCARSESKGYRHFLYGGNVGVAGELRAALIARYPDLQIVGTYTPPFRQMNQAEIEGLRQQVAAAKPDVLWVGLSTPKQERFMRSFLHRLEVKVMVGVGAAFDIHTGRIHDAPAWMKRGGLQWLHRLLQEPRRLGRRYLVNNPLFLARLCSQLLSDAFSGRLPTR